MPRAKGMATTSLVRNMAPSKSKNEEWKDRFVGGD